MAGTDTTSHLLTIATYELARDPELQKKIRDEAFNATKGKEDNYEYESLSK